MNIKEIIKTVKENNPNPQIDLIKKAYNLAKIILGESKRKINPQEKNIAHSLAVAQILANLKLDETTIAAGLLHNAIKDQSGLNGKKILEELGEEVLFLIKEVNKLKEIKEKITGEQKEITRRMLLAHTKDIRVIFIKIANCLANMKHIKRFDPVIGKALAKSAEQIFVPIAYKLGIQSIRSELEELAFAYLNPKEYEELAKKVVKKNKEREEIIKQVQTILSKELEKNKISFKISSRIKKISSIYNKIHKKKVPFEQIEDIMALRIITKTKKESYQVLGIVHNLWKPIPGKTVDYITNPKENMYQSIHTKVIIALKKEPVEIQIRTEKMHDTAEDGIAAHWNYKGLKENDESFERKMIWLKEMLEANKEIKDIETILHLGFFDEKIYTLTPKGRVIELVNGSTPIDFAYAIHSSVGESCAGAKINDKLKSLSTSLNNGDCVEILTRKGAHPSMEWLKIVRTQKAAHKIKQYFKRQGKPSIRSLIKKEIAEKILEESLVDLPPNYKEIKIAKCCNPLPGDKIKAFPIKGGKIKVHKEECNITKRGQKPVKVSWKKEIKKDVLIEVEGTNQKGMFTEILNIIKSNNNPLKKVGGRSLIKGASKCSFVLSSTKLDILKNLINRLKKVRGVKKVYIRC